MKKIILVAALVLGFAVAASAQPRALGVRIGNVTSMGTFNLDNDEWTY